jgi:FSR family fosmidomycin resistance protein-like MFS transporter
MKRDRHLYLLMIGHACADMGGGSLPALLPFLIVQNEWSYTMAAGLVFAANIVSSVTQPFIGYLGDRFSKPWLMCLGIVLSGGGIAVIGFLSDFRWCFVAVAVAGFGCALFHPEGAKLANALAGDKKASGMSVFTFGGNLGVSAGPLILSGAMLLFGLRGTIVFLIPALILAGALFFKLGTFNKVVVAEKKIKIEAGIVEKEDWKGFSKVTCAMFIHSVTSFGFTTFLPIFWVTVLLRSATEGSLMLTISAAAGSLAILLGGSFAEKYGYKHIILGSALIGVPLYLSFALSRNVPVEILIVVLISLIASGPRSPMIAMAQSFTPNKIGFSSGITMGLATSLGGMTSPLLGRIGDAFGLNAVMLTIAGLAVVCAAVTAWLPKNPGLPQFINLEKGTIL